MNPRFEAFLKVNADRIWRSKPERNAAFMAFIADMRRKYIEKNNLNKRCVGEVYITDQDDFTQFILNTVNNDNHRR